MKIASGESLEGEADGVPVMSDVEFLCGVIDDI